MFHFGNSSDRIQKGVDLHIPYLGMVIFETRAIDHGGNQVFQLGNAGLVFVELIFFPGVFNENLLCCLIGRKLAVSSQSVHVPQNFCKFQIYLLVYANVSLQIKHYNLFGAVFLY